MHEFSISDEIVKNVLGAVKENKAQKVLSIQLEIGELALLNVEQVTFWIREMFKGSVAEGARVKVRTIKARIQCESCGYRGGMNLDQRDPFPTRHSLFLSEMPVVPDRRRKGTGVSSQKNSGTPIRLEKKPFHVLHRFFTPQGSGGIFLSRDGSFGTGARRLPGAV